VSKKRSELSDEDRARQQANWRRYYDANRDAILARRQELAVDKPKRVRDYSAESKVNSEKRQTKDGWIHLSLIHARHRAKKKGLPFDITADDIELPEFCPVLGIKLVIGEGQNPRRNYASPTLDRVKNEKGYVRGNVRVISARANSLKSDASVEEMEAVIAYMKEDEPKPAKKPKIIHINRQHLAMNAKDGGNRPVITMKDNGKTRYAREVIIHGPSRMIYNGSTLSCGARTWLTTAAEVELIDEMSFQEARVAID
jgi:hypothetical protein